MTLNSQSEEKEILKRSLKNGRTEERMVKISKLNEDFRYMKIHIFALRWKDEN